MEKIQPGKYVELIYILYVKDADGNENAVHVSDPEDPERIIFGVTRGVIPELEKALDGKTKGDKFDVVAVKAFGDYDPEQVATLDKEVFMIEGKFNDDLVKAGAVVPMMTADGFRIDGKVLEVGDKSVKIDFNHPLAGKDVRFDGEVKEVRDATPEELKPAAGCSCGCDCNDDCNCNGEENCGCGGSCN